MDTISAQCPFGCKREVLFNKNENVVLCNECKAYVFLKKGDDKKTIPPAFIGHGFKKIQISIRIMDSGNRDVLSPDYLLGIKPVLSKKSKGGD